MSNTKAQIEPQVVSLTSTVSAGGHIRPQTAHSSIRSSHDRDSVETLDKARAGVDEEVMREKVEEGVIEAQMYEKAHTHKRRNFLRRHWFVITISIIGLIVAGIVAGVLVAKTALDMQRSGGGYVTVTTTDPSGGLHTTVVPDAIASFLSTHYATPMATS